MKCGLTIWASRGPSRSSTPRRSGAATSRTDHRALLFIAQVDPETLRVIRCTERMLVPERGARLGNFGVTEVNDRETWVTVAEWMQTNPPKIVIPPDNQYGADNSVDVARILWDEANSEWNQR